MKKFIYFMVSVILITSCLLVNVSALNVNDTYSDVASTSSQANNLINYAMSYDDFLNSDFVIFCNAQNSYYIVWSDELVYDGSIVKGTDIQYIRYYRSGTTGNNAYVYDYGVDSSFNLRSTYVCTSNIKDFGFRSAVFEDYYHQHIIKSFCILIASFLFVMFISALRGHK